jgi:maltooligosyltrehalose trehalohydrolase
VRRRDLVLYEVHIGTWTADGTFDAAIARLPALVELGVTAVEVMPVAHGPGVRTWGYDGVLPFAVQQSYGGPQAFQRFVDACHRLGLAVILDVVFNHFGPEGNRLGTLIPLTTENHRTPWGAAINLDGPGSDGVRALFLACAAYWVELFHCDGLRLDAVHALHDESGEPFLAQLARVGSDLAERVGRPVHLIAESDLNASRMVRPVEGGGLGMHAQWLDDFHHSLHALLTGERHGYYADFGTVADLRRAYAQAFVYAHRWSPQRQMTFGDQAGDLPTDRFVVCAQNHDQIGNRFTGERLSQLTSPAGLRCAAAAVLLSPYLPLLFMGEEDGATTPFTYFADHQGAELKEAVRAGRRREFADQAATSMPDPFAAETMAACVVPLRVAADDGLRGLYRACLALRRTMPSLRPGPRRHVTVSSPHPLVILIAREQGACQSLFLLNATAEAAPGVPLPAGRWRVALDTEHPYWGGGGAAQPHACSEQLDVPARSGVLLVPESSG